MTLDVLESESIEIFREAVAGAERPVLLYSIGKDSSVLMRLALKAFHPSPPSFPLLQIDNKMDLVGYSQPVFDAIVDAYLPFATGCGITSVAPIPISALEGDHLVASSARMPWYDGPTVMSYLETIEMSGPPSSAPFRMPVQWINRPGPDFRGAAGRVCSGAVRPGDRVRVLPSGVETCVNEIVTGGATARARKRVTPSH